MADALIGFNTGFETIELNGDPNKILRFNPRDMSFPDRFIKASKAIDGLIDEFGGLTASQSLSEAESLSDTSKAVFARMAEIGGDINRHIDSLFGIGVSAAICGSAHPLTVTFTTDGDGEEVPDGTIISNFLEAITPYLKEKFAVLEKMSAAKREKYTKPWKK